MGLKAAVFAVYQGEAGYFGSAPAADPGRSAELAGRLPLGVSGDGRAAALDLWPPSSSVGVGAYDRGALVVHRSLLDDCMRVDQHRVAEALLRMYPAGSLVCFGLDSVVNYFGYTVVEQGRVRRFGGAEDHIDEDVGEILPEEVPHFENSTVRDRMRYFVSPEFPGEEFDAPAYGEELVMSLTARLFGRPLNQLHEAPVNVLYFPRRPWWHFWR